MFAGGSPDVSVIAAGRFTGDDKELSVEDRGDRFPYPYQKVYTIQLYSPVSWEVRMDGTGILTGGTGVLMDWTGY